MRCCLVPLVLFLFLGTTIAGKALAGEKWPGVDEQVVERIAREQGREARGSLLPVEGDLQLLAFLMAGAVGGFAAGYYWRALLEGKKGENGERGNGNGTKG